MMKCLFEEGMVVYTRRNPLIYEARGAMQCQYVNMSIEHRIAFGVYSIYRIIVSEPN